MRNNKRNTAATAIEQQAIVCLTIVICLIGGSTMVRANDAVTEEAALSQELRDTEAEYTRLSGKEPTTEHLLDSLKSENARGEKAREIIVALKIVGYKGESATVAGQIQACYEKNAYWLVRISCAGALVRIDKEKGIDLSRKIIKDTEIGLEAKLLLTQDLLAVKIPDGYPALKEGLVTSNAYLRKMALNLVAQFRPYDGISYGDSGQKIDISGTIAEARKTAQSILYDIDKAATKAQTQPK